MGSAGVGRVTGGLSKSLSSCDTYEAARAKRCRRADARRVGGLDRRSRGAGRPRAARYPPLWRRRSARPSGRTVRAAQRVRRAAAPPAPRRGSRLGGAGRAGTGVPRAGRGHERRPVRRACGPSAVRRADVRSPPYHARRRGAAARAQRRAVSEIAGGDGAALCGSPRRAGGYRGARGAARVHDGRPGIPLSEVSRAGRRDGGGVSTAHHGGWRARTVSPVPRQGPHPDRARAQFDREARPRRLLPHRVGHRQLRAAAGHPRAGTRLRRQQRRLLQPGDHRRRSDCHGPAVRALSLRGAR